MWIRSQNKEELMKINHISVYGCAIKGFNTANDAVLGIYSTEEKVLKVMNMLEEEIRLDTCQTRVFQMPQDNEVK